MIECLKGEFPPPLGWERWEQPGISAWEEFFQPGAVSVGTSAFQNPAWGLQEMEFLSLLSQTFPAHLDLSTWEMQIHDQEGSPGKSICCEAWAWKINLWNVGKLQFCAVPVS